MIPSLWRSPFPRSWSRGVRPLLGSALALALDACASLPSSGPTADAISAAQRRTAAFSLVTIDTALVEQLAAPPPPDPSRLAGLGAAGAVDVLGPGDVLQVSIYEVGAALFSGRSGGAMASAAGAFSPPSGSAETLPPIVVGRDGAINLPWIGRLAAAGKTPDDLAAEIAAALHGKSQDPQVVVSVRENVTNTVMMTGEVKKPGRLPLSLAGERLSDAIAMAGGPANAVQDSVVLLSRGELTVSAPLGVVVAGSPQDVALRPRDRITVLYQPRTFTVFGASGKVSEIPFQSPRVSLAEAIARAGGPDDRQADPSAVFVFRYAQAASDGTPLTGAKPVAYRLDLLQAQSYFLAQGFEMKPRDVIYIANARANQPTKFIQILNTFFSPVYTAKVLAQ
uniref:Polysaccharide export protein n=1 Tax=Caulobacter sp. (strain K31) TaxID=366602 RepID=B0T6Z2_CAUSK